MNKPEQEIILKHLSKINKEFKKLQKILEKNTNDYLKKYITQGRMAIHASQFIVERNIQTKEQYEEMVNHDG